MGWRLSKGLKTPVLACLDHPLPLSGGAALHANGPGRDFGWVSEKHNPEKGDPFSGKIMLGPTELQGTH
jgi:hypothetical protein